MRKRSKRGTPEFRRVEEAREHVAAKKHEAPKKALYRNQPKKPTQVIAGGRAGE